VWCRLSLNDVCIVLVARRTHCTDQHWPNNPSDSQTKSVSALSNQRLVVPGFVLGVEWSVLHQCLIYGTSLACATDGHIDVHMLYIGALVCDAFKY
jgi:hypothetical protein